MLATLLILGLAGAAPGDFDRGNTLLESGDLVAAEEAFRQALADDADADAASQLGFSLMEQGLFDKAIEVLVANVAAHPGHEASNWYLGVARFQRGEYRKAVERLQPLVATMGERPGVGVGMHWYLASSYAQLLSTEGITQAEADQLIASCRVYVHALPDDEESTRLRGLADYVEQKRPPRSVARWVVKPDHDAVTEEIAERADTIVIEQGRMPDTARRKPRRYRWVDCDHNVGCRLLRPVQQGRVLVRAFEETVSLAATAGLTPAERNTRAERIWERVTLSVADDTDAPSAPRTVPELP